MFVPLNYFIFPQLSQPLSCFQKSLPQQLSKILKSPIHPAGKLWIMSGGPGSFFACLAHMRVAFIAEQLLFTERRYRAVS